MTLAFPHLLAANWYYFQHCLSPWVVSAELQIRSAPPAEVRLPVFMATVSWPLGAGVGGERESPGDKKSQMPLLLMRLSSFLSNKRLPNCCLPLLTSRIPKWLLLIILPVFPIAFLSQHLHQGLAWVTCPPCPSFLSHDTPNRSFFFLKYAVNNSFRKGLWERKSFFIHFVLLHISTAEIYTHHLSPCSGFTVFPRFSRNQDPTVAEKSLVIPSSDVTSASFCESYSFWKFY